jgi:Protein ChrB, N-terminal
MMGATGVARQAGRWVLLCYRLPREPSTPRITVWRKLERLGAARLNDGLVGLPADARTREQFEWLAQEIIEVGGVASVWLGSPVDAAQEEAVADILRDARAVEYAAVTAAARRAAEGTPDEAARSMRRLREQLSRIARRDFFPTPQREHAYSAVEALAGATVPGRRSASAR